MEGGRAITFGQELLEAEPGRFSGNKVNVTQEEHEVRQTVAVVSKETCEQKRLVINR
jgi:hypothetical protein